MSKIVAIVQSNYIPWKGYFDLIHMADEFILYDDAQFTKRDWRNRNKLKTPQGVRWLSIPVKARGRFHQRISETEIANPHWTQDHLKTWQHNYARAPHYAAYKDWLAELYQGCTETHLSRVNYRFLRAICDELSITTPLTWSSDYGVDETLDKTEKLVALCQKAGADVYLSGPAARVYLREEAFRRVGIAVQYMDYSGYPEYPQLYPPFEHGVSVLDLILNTGPEAPRYMKSFAGNH